MAVSHEPSPWPPAASAAMRHLKRILHVDMDAFYASVEQRDNPSLKGLPVAVGGDPSGRACRGGGELRGTRVWGALGDPDGERRSPVPAAGDRAVPASSGIAPCRTRCSRFRGITPLVEPLSLDEAYLDVTENAWNEPLGMRVAQRLKQASARRPGSPPPRAWRRTSFSRRSRRGGTSRTA